MRNFKTLNTFAAALLVTLAASTADAAQTSRQSQANSGVLDVIALQTYVEGRNATYGVKPAQPIPVNTGERIRIHLVGTAIINGNGVEREIPARFTVAAGRGQIDIVQSGPTWALVQVNSRGDDGIAQLGYEVTSNEYDMKGGLRQGRITLEIGEAEMSSAPGSVGTDSVDRARWTRARELTDQLYRSIVGAAPQGDQAQRDLEHIYEMGAIGVRDVALALANDVNTRFDRLPQDDAVEVLGDLYRGLLRRDLSNQQLWDMDPGFRNNTNTLRQRGYVTTVQVLVESEEFRSANSLSQFGNLAGYNNNTAWRTTPSRYAIRQY